MAADSAVRAFWRRKGVLNAMLLPIAGAFVAASALRRRAYQRGWLPVSRLPVPVVVVGSLTAGGGGKTSLVIALARALAAAGRRPGVVSRGYRGAEHRATIVGDDADPGIVGDEPAMIRAKTGVPVAVGAKRADAGRLLLERHPDIDTIISDDGLQHYALARDFEVVADGGFGNGWPLPAGPMRERLSRLATADAVVRWHGEDGHRARLVVDGVRKLGGAATAVADLSDRHVVAMAGISNPEGFFSALRDLGVGLKETRALGDHHRFSPEDFAGLPENAVVVVTEKDAVKCLKFGDPRLHVLETHAEIGDELVEAVLERIDRPKVS